MAAAWDAFESDTAGRDPSLYDTVVWVPETSAIAAVMLRQFMPQSMVTLAADGALRCTGDEALAETITRAGVGAVLDKRVRAAIVDGGFRMGNGDTSVSGLWLGEHLELRSDGTQYSGADFYRPLLRTQFSDAEHPGKLGVSKIEVRAHLAAAANALDANEAARLADEVAGYEESALPPQPGTGDLVRVAASSESAPLIASFMYGRDALLFGYAQTSGLTLKGAASLRLAAVMARDPQIAPAMQALLFRMLESRARSSVYLQCDAGGAHVSTSVAALLTYQRRVRGEGPRLDFEQTLQDLLPSEPAERGTVYRDVAADCEAHFAIDKHFYEEVVDGFTAAYGGAPDDKMVECICE